MTQPGQPHEAEEGPAPPTSTRWTEGETDDSVHLMPPFVPGRTAPSTAAPPVPATPAHPASPPAEPESEPQSEPEPAAVHQAPAVAMEPGPADAEKRDGAELADRLEGLADRLRSEGPSAARAAMASEDRLTALLGGLLAGYLAGSGR